MTFQLKDNAAEMYERVLVPLWFGRWAEELVRASGIEAGETVLDVACGTGVTTRMAHARVGPTGRVDGLDINAAMLRKAGELAEDLDIRWIEGDVTETGLPDGSYDAVISQHGYHYFPDKPAALREFRRLLKPNGRLIFSIWDGPSAYTGAVCAAVERHISEKVAAQQRAQRETPSAESLRDEVEAAGFGAVEVRRCELTMDVPAAEDFVPLHLASMPIAAAFGALAPTARTALIRDVAMAMRPYAEGDRMRYPDAVHMVIGRV